MELLSNQWAISAGMGLASGLIVMLIVRHLYSARDQREYHRNLAAANAEIVCGIRPAIAQKVIPSNAMLDALYSATARKYGVDSRDLLPKVGLANQLMKEVIDNTFLSSQQKVDYCEHLARMKQLEPGPSSKQSVEILSVVTRADAADPSGLLGLTAGLTAFIATVLFYMRDKADFLAGGQLLKVLPVLAIVIIIPIIAFLLRDLMRQTMRPRREFEDEAMAAPGAVAPSPVAQDSPPPESEPMRTAPQEVRP